MRRFGNWTVLVVVALGLWNCGGKTDTKTVGEDVTTDLVKDVQAEDSSGLEVGTEVQDDGVVELDVVAEVDVVPGLPPLPTRAPLAVPENPLEGSEVESCALFQEERCVDGKLQSCSVYDVPEGKWVEDPDPMFKRVLLFDRWRDLYNSPDGQAVDRDFSKEVLPGTPEEEWSHPDYFDGYWGSGDGGIWTGWSTVASILRYAQTGTEADYQRMEQQVRDMVTMYDVTGVPGYVCRYHYLLVPEGTPNDTEHILRWEHTHNLGHHDRPVVNPEGLTNLPAIYTEGITDDEGTVWKGTPMWHGRPSIDQSSGPMTSLPMAYALLQDDELKEKIVHHLTCYLKRLQRIELINLQENPDLVEGLLAYFSVGELQLDPDDIDLTKLDRIVAYVNRQINTKNEATFDLSCPDSVQLEPWRVIDASSDTFLLDMLDLIGDMDTDDERENQIDHYYFPSIRGGDAMHMMHLATMAYYLTGDEQYREFLYEELIGEIDTLGVLRTAGAFDLPKFCKKYFGDQITFGPWWAFMHLLADSDLKNEVQQAYHGEMWDKLVSKAGNVDFNIMYAGALDASIASDREMALTYALEQLEWMGGNGGLFMGSPDDPAWLLDPRRTYTTTAEGILAATPDGIEAACPTQNEVDICSAEIEIMGIKMPNLTGWKTHDCAEGPYECEVSPGQCTRAQASGPLPVHLRNHTDYLWQRNPFSLGAGAALAGKRQFAGSDYSVPFWNARRYGFVESGEGQVLAWEDIATCEQ
jgi:hypothetical protein